MKFKRSSRVCSLIAIAILAVLDQRAAAAVINVACVGDSITYGADASSAATSYPSDLSGLLGSAYNVGNFGVSGSTLLSNGDMPYINQSAYPASQAFAPNIVVIMLGTNDSKPQNWVYSADFVADYTALINTYRALPSNPLVFICTCCPVYNGGNYGITEPIVANGVNPLILQIAANLQVPVIDVYTAMNNVPQDFVDGVHPNDAGYALMAACIFNAITPPAAAAMLIAQVNTSSQVALAWHDQSTNADGFVIERGLVGGALTQIAVAVSSAATYDDSSAEPGVTYVYQVVAYNAAGMASPSNAVQVTVPAVVASSTPANGDSGRHCGHGGMAAIFLMLTLAGLVRMRQAAGI